MGIRLNREAYEGLIAGNIARVEKEMVHSPERMHILMILKASPEREYGPPRDESGLREPEDLDELLLGAIEHLEWHGLALGKEASEDKDPPRWSAFELWRNLTAARTALTQQETDDG